MNPIADNDFEKILHSFRSEESTPAPVLPPECRDLQRMVRRTLEELADLHLSSKAQQTIREFLCFHMQTLVQGNDHREARGLHYNLLICTEDTQAARKIADVLYRKLQPLYQVGSFRSISEAELIQYHQKRMRRTGPEKSYTPRNEHFLFLHSCQAEPRYDLDLPSPSMVAESKKAVDDYHNAWKELRDYFRGGWDGCGHRILIVQADKEVCRTSLKNQTELYFRLCGHHISIEKPNEEVYLKDCLAQLRRSSFALCPGFEEQVTAYFHSVYPRAEMREKEFTQDLLRRIYSLYFSRGHQDGILTLDCIPLYHAQTASAEDVLEQMEALVGLESVKREFRNLYTVKLAGIDAAKTRYHMLFTGNPGTGKTTVAKMAADLLYRMGILRTNKLVATKPAEMISMWRGATGKKTTSIIQSAYGGVLFIDEAYGLAINNELGAEALNCLIQEMEEHSDRLVVILAGYEREMYELLKLNPGLSSRIGRQIHFADYDLEELVQIFHRQLDREGFAMDPAAAELLTDCISDLMSREFFGNAREISNLIQRLKQVWSDEYYQQARQLGSGNVTMAKVFLPRHFEQILPPKKNIGIQDLVGLEPLKQKLETFRQQILYQKHLREKGISISTGSSMHMLFMGNPGTGKTTVAQLLADDLYAIGVLKTNRLVIAERRDLVSSVPGQTAQKTAEVIQKAVGGVLFVDEAYTLTDSALGNEVIEVLLTAMEDHRSDTVFIFAGYPQQMQEFLALNPGLQSRIGYTFYFDDYSTGELMQMFCEKLIRSGFTLTEQAQENAGQIMEYFRSVRYFGNGRFVAHVIQQTIAKRAQRSFAESYRDITAEDIPTVGELIETAPNGMRLYDPAEVTQEELRRTALHELGHALALYIAAPDSIPGSISIRLQSGSLGRVSLPAVSGSGNMTEEEMLNRIVGLLSGKNAEKVFFGSHSTGCSNDFHLAKTMAKKMLELFAMDTYGGTPGAILKTADSISMELITGNKTLLEQCAEILLERQELTGEEFRQMLVSRAEQPVQ